MTNIDACTVRLIRRDGYSDMLRSYRILINGKQAGTIGRNSVLEIQAPRGTITVEARVDWCRSEPLTIDAKSCQQIEIEVSNKRGLFGGLSAVTSGYRSYLKLELLSTSEGGANRPA